MGGEDVVLLSPVLMEMVVSPGYEHKTETEDPIPIVAPDFDRSDHTRPNADPNSVAIGNGEVVYG